MAPIRKKLVIVGDASSGKTRILTVFSKGLFPWLCDPIVCENGTVSFQVDGKQVELLVSDTTEQEEYRGMRALSYLDAHVILLCFSIGSAQSLKSIEDTWYPEVRHFCPKVPVVLVGSEKELRSDGVRTVSAEEGKAMAGKINAFDYVECSVETNEGVREVFEVATRAARTYSRKNKQSKGKCVIS